jgi:hypothetical protein
VELRPCWQKSSVSVPARLTGVSDCRLLTRWTGILCDLVVADPLNCFATGKRLNFVSNSQVLHWTIARRNRNPRAVQKELPPLLTLLPPPSCVSSLSFFRDRSGLPSGFRLRGEQHIQSNKRQRLHLPRKRGLPGLSSRRQRAVERPAIRPLADAFCVLASMRYGLSA